MYRKRDCTEAPVQSLFLWFLRKIVQYDENMDKICQISSRSV